MPLLKHLKHYNDILWLLYKYGHKDLLKDFSSELDLPKILKERGKERGKASDLVHDLESLGPFYIKLGQILGAGFQLLPPEFDEALEKLQDHAEPMPYSDVESVILSELGALPHNLFKSFEKTPLSAASLGQVHVAELQSGKKVAIKVQRKDIQKTILEQLETLGQISEFLEEKTEWGKKYQVLEKFQNLKTILLNELDYTKEANNLKILSEHLKKFERLIIPKPVNEYTTSRVLTMEYIQGDKLTELSEIKKVDINGPLLAKELFKAFLYQILIDGFFQMDPHPGNIYLTKKDIAHSFSEMTEESYSIQNKVTQKPVLALLDLGMVAHVPFQMQNQLLRCLFALSLRHELEVTRMMIAMGKTMPNFDEYIFRTRISDVIAGYRGHTISDVSLGKVIIKLASVAAETGLWLPGQFSTIGKTFLSLSSVLQALDSEFNPDQQLKEISKDLIQQRLSNKFSSNSFYGTYLDGIEFLEHLPGKLNQALEFISKSDHQFKIQLQDGKTFVKNIEKIANRITMGLILAALVIGAALMMKVNTPFHIFGYPGFAMAMFLLAAAGGFALIFSIIWNHRKDK